MIASYSEPTQDEVLWNKVAQGCEQSFRLLYEKYWQSTYTAAYNRLKDAEQAKDIVQEIFTHLWMKRDSLQLENLQGYLHVAVRNRVLKQVSKEKQHHPFFDLLENLPAGHLQADAGLLAKEFFKAYEALINTLPAKKQLIFRLRYQEDLSTREIALELGLSRKTVQNQLGKAVEQLRVSLILLLLLFVSLLYTLIR